MSYQKPVIKIFTAEADLSTHQYKQVKHGTTEGQVVLAGNEEVAHGVLMNAPKLGELAEVAVMGGALVKLSATIAAGASICCGASGVAKAAVATKHSLGVLEAGGVSGDVVPMIIDRHFQPA